MPVEKKLQIPDCCILKLIADIDFKFAEQDKQSITNTSLILLKTVQNLTMQFDIAESNDTQVWFPLH